MRRLEALGISRQEAESISARIWARLRPRLFRALKEAVPAEEPHCIHSCGPGYCEVKGCEHS